MKKKTPDFEEAKSLLKNAKEKLDYFKNEKITDKDAFIVFENIYSSMRKSAQSLMSIKGFKPYSHEATISFLKEFHKKQFTEEDINKFDRFRLLRSDSEYRAETISKEDAESSVEFAKKIIEKIQQIMKDEI